MSSRRSHPSSRSGFTLLELIVVITIIGLLASVVVVNTMGVTAKGRRAKIEADMKQILTVASTLNTTSGKFPQTIEEMVNAKDENGTPAMAYLESMPKDPWNHEYIYSIEGGRPQVKCLGNDNAEGGEGEAEDVIRPEVQGQ